MAKARKIHENLPEPQLSEEMQKALVSLNLENISLSTNAMTNIQLFDSGQITEKEFIKRAIERAKS